MAKPEQITPRVPVTIEGSTTVTRRLSIFGDTLEPTKSALIVRTQSLYYLRHNVDFEFNK